MVYTANVPQATQTFQATQAPINANFQGIQTLVGINHVQFDLADQGKHKWVSMPIQAANPGTLATEMALYTKTSTLSTVPEMFIQRADASVVEFTSALNSSVGWTRLPSGILIKWGNASANGNTVYAYPTGATIPVFTNVFSVSITTEDASATDANVFVRLTNYNTTTITVYSSQRTTTSVATSTFQYIAIGR